MKELRKIAVRVICAMAFGVAYLSTLNARAEICDEACLRQALTNGGNYVIASSGSVALTGGPLSIPPGIVVSLDAGTNTVLISGNSGQILVVNSNANAFLGGITFQNGQSTTGGAIYIEPDATLVLTNCIFIGNKAVGADGDAGADGDSHKWDNGGNGKKGLPGEDAYGGAIYNLGTLLVARCQFLTNSALGGNGGDGGNGGNSDNYNGGNGGSGGNAGSAYGGAIYNNGRGFYTIDTTFSGNSATGGDGGSGGSNGTGLWRDGVPGNGGKGGVAVGAGTYSFSPFTNSAMIWNSTFSDNSATGGTGKDGGGTLIGIGNDGARGGNASGAGVFNVGGLQLLNDTFYHNLATGGAAGNGGAGNRGGNGGNGGTASGGGLCNTGAVFVTNCTFALNGVFGGTNGVGASGITSGRNGGKGGNHGGNIANLAPKKVGPFVLKNTIIGTNVSGGGEFGNVTDVGYNIGADKTVKLKMPTSLKRTDPKLAAFGDYGGPTKTIALLTNSPAIDMIRDSSAPPFDQRGISRPQGPFSDAGAFESGPLFIEDQPQSQTVSVGASVTFSVGVLGDPPLTYTWYFDQTNRLSSSTSSSFTISSVSTNQAGDYFVVVSNANGSVTSAVATLTVLLTPAITTQPADQNVVVTNSATFSVTAAGQPPLYYQWYSTNNASSVATAISGATNSTYSIASVSTNDAGGYFVVVTNNYGSITSRVAILTVQVAPSITSQPASQTVSPGSSATFTVTAVGAMPLYYQWQFNTTNILADATNASLTITNAQTTNAGFYSVLVTNTFGSVLSSNATLKVSSSVPVP